MKKPYFPLLLALLALCLFTACSRQGTNNTTTKDEEMHNLTPTGYPSGEVQQPQIMYNDTIFYYRATASEVLPDNYSYVGKIETIDNETPLCSNFTASYLNIGQKVYANPDTPDLIYIDYTDTYYHYNYHCFSLTGVLPAQD